MKSDIVQCPAGTIFVVVCSLERALQILNDAA